MDTTTNPSTPQDTRRGPDGLTRDGRRAFYQPNNWTVRQVGAQRYQATCTNGQSFECWLPYGPMSGTILVKSNTGNVHQITAGACTCEDSHTRALDEQRLCKHQSCCEALEEFIGREQRLAAARRERAEIFGDPFARFDRAA